MIVPVGKRDLNLDYLIMTEEIDGDGDLPDVLRVTMYPGKEFDLPAEEGRILRRSIREAKEARHKRSQVARTVVPPRDGEAQESTGKR